MTKKVKAFTLHNNRGQSVLMSQLSGWRDPTDESNDIFGPVVRYSWSVDDFEFEMRDEKNMISLRELPDSSGFVCFEKPSVPDNFLLLDIYGKKRLRLSVPWELTKPQNPQSAKPPTAFVTISSPYINPADEKEGEFGITAWVEYAGMYYFELDYQRGEFLWGLEIRD